PSGWLVPDPSAPRVSKDAVRDLGRSVASKLDVQGVAAVYAAADPSMVRVALLASGSGESDVIVVRLTDAASRAAAVDAIGRPLPPLTAPSIETTLIDVEGVQGAVVVRPGAAAAQAGLAAGDTIVGAGG